jgi:CheY-like chemotaxis protein
MVHGIVRRHGGQLWIESAPGTGTKVRIELPLGGAAGETGAQMAESEVPPLHILVVDDDPHVRAVTELLLVVDGHTVVTAAGGHEALERCRVDCFDVVITDRAMPGVNGDELARAVKRVAPATPVIMLTGFGDLMLATGSRPAGVDLILSKPASGARLRDAIATVTLAENGAGAAVCPDAVEVPAEPRLAERC